MSFVRVADSHGCAIVVHQVPGTREASVAAMEIHRVNTARFAGLVCPLSERPLRWEDQPWSSGSVVVGVLRPGEPETLQQVENAQLATAWSNHVRPQQQAGRPLSACGLLYGFQFPGLVALEVTRPEAPCCHPDATSYVLLPGEWLGRLRWLTR